MVTPLRPPQRPLAQPAEEYMWTWQPGGHFMVRVFHAHPGRSPLRARTFGPLNRFDPHVRDRRGQPREQGDGRGVNYLAETLSTALAEAFPEQSPAVAICPLQNAILAGPVRPSRLLDLTGDGVMQIGAVATLASGNEPRRLTQRWGRAIYEDMPALAGIRYRGAHQGGIAVAVWERAGHLIGEMIGDPVSDGGLPLLGGALRDRTTVALAAQGRYPVRLAARDCPRCRAAHSAARFRPS